MTAAPILLGAWVVLSVLIGLAWAHPRRRDRIQAWYHHVNGSTPRWSENAWRDAAAHSLEKSRERRGWYEATDAVEAELLHAITRTRQARSKSGR